MGKKNRKRAVFFTKFLDPVTLTLKQGQVTMYDFVGLVIIHHHATFGEDRFNSV
jgi:hypothetical protein